MATLFLYVLPQPLLPLPVCGTAQQQRRRVCDALFCTSQATTFSMRNVPQKHILCENVKKLKQKANKPYRKTQKCSTKRHLSSLCYTFSHSFQYLHDFFALNVNMLFYDYLFDETSCHSFNLVNTLHKYYIFFTSNLSYTARLPTFHVSLPTSTVLSEASWKATKPKAAALQRRRQQINCRLGILSERERERERVGQPRERARACKSGEVKRKRG